MAFASHIIIMSALQVGVGEVVNLRGIGATLRRYIMGKTAAVLELPSGFDKEEWRPTETVPGLVLLRESVIDPPEQS